VPKLLTVFWGIALVTVGTVWGETEFLYLEGSDLNVFGNFQGVALGDAGEETFLYLTRQDGRGTLFSWKNSRAQDITENLPKAAGEPGAEGGAAWIDYDGDGLQDLYISRFQRPNLLYKRKELGKFEEVAEGLGLDDQGPNQGMAWADFDADGDLDLYLTNFGFPNRLYLNECRENGVFREVGKELGVDDDGRSLSATWGDFDGDGDLDLYVVNYGQINRLYQYNNRDTIFVEVAQRLNVRDSGQDRKDISAGWVDFDTDGDLDLSLTRYDEPNRLYHNSGEREREPSPFEDVAQKVGLDDRGQGQMMAWADYDRDGDQDVYVVNGGDQTADLSWLYENDQGKRFANVTTTVGLTEASGGARRSKGAIWWDMDEDGALDLYMVNFRQENRIYRNTRNETTGKTDIWLSVKMHDETPCNRYSIGSKLRVSTGKVEQTHYLGLSANYLSQGSQRLLIGLPSGGIKSLVVEWPDGYEKDVKGSISRNTPSSQTIRRSEAKLSISGEDEIKFGKVPVWERTSAVASISNDGEADLRIESVFFSPKQVGHIFGLENVEVPFSIAPDSSYQFGVIFSPKKKANYHQALWISSNGGRKRLVLKGEGSSKGVLIIEPDTVFIDIDSQSGKVNLKKSGSGNVAITNYQFFDSKSGRRITNFHIRALDDELRKKGGEVVIEKPRSFKITAGKEGPQTRKKGRLLSVFYGPGNEHKEIPVRWKKLERAKKTPFEKTKPYLPLGIGIAGTIGFIFNHLDDNDDKYNESLISVKAEEYWQNAKKAKTWRNISGLTAIVGFGTYLFREHLSRNNGTKEEYLFRKGPFDFGLQDGEAWVKITRGYGKRK